MAEKVLTPEIEKEISALFEDVPMKKAASIDALKVVQKHQGWVSDDALKEVADLLEISFHELDAVATFYNMIFRRPVGKNVIMLCDSVSCYIMGYDSILKGLEDRLGITLGETTPDNKFTLLPIPCLGNCDHAPTMLIGEDLYNDLTEDKLDGILSKY